MHVQSCRKFKKTKDQINYLLFKNNYFHLKEEGTVQTSFINTYYIMINYFAKYFTNDSLLLDQDIEHSGFVKIELINQRIIGKFSFVSLSEGLFQVKHTMT